MKPEEFPESLRLIRTRAFDLQKLLCRFPEQHYALQMASSLRQEIERFAATLPAPLKPMAAPLPSPPISEPSVTKGYGSGVGHPKSKFDAAQVLDIRRRSKAGASVSALAREFKVTWKTINSIVTGESYTDVGVPA